jgi:single-strand DNA-binding protein
MANYNKVILMGNLTRDPQLTFLPSQTPVVEFGLAVNRRWRDQQGQQREDTCFIDCRCYGKQAETMNKYLSKGRPVLIEGRLQLDQWESKDGQKRSKHRVFVERFTFVDSGGGGGGGSRPAQRPQAEQPAPAGGDTGGDAGGDYDEPPPSEYDEGGEDGIPF